MFALRRKERRSEHLWWECRALNRHSDFGYLKLVESRRKHQNQPECFWNNRVVTTDWTTLPDSEHMMAEDVCHECKGTAKLFTLTDPPIKSDAVTIQDGEYGPQMTTVSLKTDL